MQRNVTRSMRKSSMCRTSLFTKGMVNDGVGGSAVMSE